MIRNFTTRSARVHTSKERERETAGAARLAPFFSPGRKETTEWAIIRAQHRPRHRRRLRLRRRRRRSRCRYCRPARYDNFTFIDRSGRTTLYLSLHPRTLSFRVPLSLSAATGLSSLSLPRSLALMQSARSLFTVLVVQGRYGGCASSKLKRSCTLGIRGLACTYIIRRKLRRAM